MQNTFLERIIYILYANVRIYLWMGIQKAVPGNVFSLNQHRRRKEKN